MKTVLALIYLPIVSRSVSRVKEFRRSEAHDNILCYEGRGLTVEEFNKVAPRVLGENARGLYGMQPTVKLMEIETVVTPPPEGVPDSEKTPSTTSPSPAAKPPPVVNLPECGIEPIADGFMLVDYSASAARYMGTAGAWEDDAALVAPFASEDEARKACPGKLVAKPATVEETVESSETESEAAPEETTSEVGDVPQGSEPSQVGEAEAPLISGAVAESSAPSTPPATPAPSPAPAKKAAKKAPAKKAK